MSALAERQRAFLKLCFRAQPPEAELEVLGSHDRERWLMYRDMVRSRLLGMLRNGLPRTAQALGDEAFAQWYAKWVDAAPPTTRYIRAIIGNFVDWAAPKWSATAELPPWLGDLARYEATRWWVNSAEAPAPSVKELDFESPPLPNPALRLLSVEHRVDKAATDSRYEASPTQLCIYRRPDDTVAAWSLNPFAGALFEQWLDDPTLSLADSVKQVAARRGAPVNAAFIDALSALLTHFLEQGILLGSRREDAD